MGHQINDPHRPRRGSLQFWPRKRARRIYPRIKTWPKLDTVGLLGFAGYKVGMTHVLYIDNRKTSPTKGMEIVSPVTVLECPPLRIFGVRTYEKTPYGLKTVGEYWNGFEKNLERKIQLPKKNKTSLEDLEKKGFDEVRVLVHTHPPFKKKPEVFEIALGGKPEEQWKFAQENLGKDVRVKDFFKEGELIDVIAVTKGKGLQGSVKRFGVKILHHKTKRERRQVGTLGPWTPKKTSWRVPQYGQMGFHTRVEYNKWILKIGEGEFNVKGGWPHYGLVKNDWILIKGSVPGAVKRLIRFRKALRPNNKYPNVVPQITYISLESKQG